MTDRYFHIVDKAHGRCVVAGEVFTTRRGYSGPDPSVPVDEMPPVYHQPHENRDPAQWRFVDAGDGHYYVLDRRHGCALGAGERYDERIYHYRDYEGRPHCRWKAATTAPGMFHLVDAKHGKALAAGDTADGRLYHQEPGERRNALWSIELANDGTAGPTFYVVDQQLVSGPTYDRLRSQRHDMPPLFVLDVTVRNDSDTDQDLTLQQSIADRSAETVTTQVSASLQLLYSSEVELGMFAAAAKAKIEVSAKYAFTYSNAVMREVVTTLELGVPVKVPAGAAVRVRGEISRCAAKVPFTFTVRRTLGDGSTVDEQENGTWQGVEYLTGGFSFTDPDAVQP
ncbi:ETX/MTX2 family pore-forming toxin [Pseudonocardia sp. TRM90224]|uniref:ETX/MTX2 family pore-forming toxin n=1 Tax=Pseudonocardia sp. TRM90224 TaxID=2812678 RepID=UPI001E378166|nr:ETX/MTX2 family pore-forming toxin [Pseudonocardia sp. TRM90224]